MYGLAWITIFFVSCEWYAMIFTHAFITHENHCWIDSLVTWKSLFTLTHTLFYMSVEAVVGTVPPSVDSSTLRCWRGRVLGARGICWPEITDYKPANVCLLCVQADINTDNTISGHRKMVCYVWPRKWTCWSLCVNDTCEWVILNLSDVSSHQGSDKNTLWSYIWDR